MGWTHSWERPTELPTEQFAKAVEDCSAVLGKIGIALAGPDGTGSPILRPDVIAFNGAKPQHCEPFEIRQVEFDRRGRQKVFSFCKTEHLPYDFCVQLALIIFRHHLGDTFHVASDGKDADWINAKTICQQFCGHGLDFSLSM